MIFVAEKNQVISFEPVENTHEITMEILSAKRRICHADGNRWFDFNLVSQNYPFAKWAYFKVITIFSQDGRVAVGFRNALQHQETARLHRKLRFNEL